MAKKPRSQATQAWLDLAGKVAHQLRQTDEQRDYLRDEFIGVIKAAKLTGATQQEIANASKYSRQRISQFLGEERKDK